MKIAILVSGQPRFHKMSFYDIVKLIGFFTFGKITKTSKTFRLNGSIFPMLIGLLKKLKKIYLLTIYFHVFI